MAAPELNSLSASSLLDPRALMSIRNLELRARLVVEGFWKGIHRSPYHGFSVEFTEYRQYTPGDDPRYLDWRVFARSDRYFIKKFEDETNLRCYILWDNSRSMAYSSVGYTKAQYSATLAATLAYFLYLQGDAVGLLTFDQQIRDFLPARHRTGHLRHLMSALEKPASGTATDFAASLKRILELVRKRGMILLLSDFLVPLHELESDLVSLCACGHEVLALQVIDPAEVTLNLEKVSMLEDMETGRSLFVDPKAARREYVRKFEAHCAALGALCRRVGASHHRLVSDRPLELALFDFLRTRMEKRRLLKRSRRTSTPLPSGSSVSTAATNVASA